MEFYYYVTVVLFALGCNGMEEENNWGFVTNKYEIKAYHDLTCKEFATIDENYPCVLSCVANSTENLLGCYINDENINDPYASYAVAFPFSIYNFKSGISEGGSSITCMYLQNDYDVDTGKIFNATQKWNCYNIRNSRIGTNGSRRIDVEAGYKGHFKRLIFYLDDELNFACPEGFIGGVLLKKGKYNTVVKQIRCQGSIANFTVKVSDLYSEPSSFTAQQYNYLSIYAGSNRYSPNTNIRVKIAFPRETKIGSVRRMEH